MALNPTKYRKIEKLIRDGYSQRDIARALKLSVVTVNKYCQAIAKTIVEKIERRKKPEKPIKPYKPRPQKEKEEEKPAKAVKIKEKPLEEIQAPVNLTPEEFEKKQIEIKYNAMTAFNNMLLELNERIRTMDDVDFKNTLIEVWEKIK